MDGGSRCVTKYGAYVMSTTLYVDPSTPLATADQGQGGAYLRRFPNDSPRHRRAILERRV